MAFKVGALSYGGGFVIIPLMQADAVDRYQWMTNGQFLNAVALGQITRTRRANSCGRRLRGGRAHRRPVGLSRRVRSVLRVRAGRSPALRPTSRERERARLSRWRRPPANGAIAGSAVSLGRALTEPWQYVVLAGASIVLLVLRRGVLPTLLAAAAAGILLTVTGLALPH